MENPFEILQQPITAYQGVTGMTPYAATVGQALNRIKLGNSREHINAVRSAATLADASNIKERLIAFTFAGKFNRRRAVNVRSFSGFAIIDIDHIQPMMVEAKKRQVIDQYQFVIACWTSPSGNGIKVLCVVDIATDVDDYKALYRGLLGKFEDADKSTSSPVSLCFESYDPNILYREPEQCEVFTTRLTPLNEVVTTRAVGIDEQPQDFQVNLSDAFTFIEGGFSVMFRNLQYGIGNRNNFIFQFSAEACEFGISQEDCRDYIVRTYNPPEDVKAGYAIWSGYRVAAHKFGVKRYKLKKWEIGGNYGYQPE